MMIIMLMMRADLVINRLQTPNAVVTVLFLRSYSVFAL